MPKRNGFTNQPNRHTADERERLAAEGVARETPEQAARKRQGSAFRISSANVLELIATIPDETLRAAMDAAVARDREAVTSSQVEIQRAAARLRIREETKDARLTEADIEARITLDPDVMKAGAAYRYACAHAHLLQAELRGLGTLEKMLGQYTALLAPGAELAAGPNVQVYRLNLDPPPAQG